MANPTKAEVRGLIAALGGCNAAARELGINQTTVSYWNTSGKLPRWRWPVIAAAAARRGIEIPPALAAQMERSAA